MKPTLLLLAVLSSLTLAACGSKNCIAPADTSGADLLDLGDLAADPCRNLTQTECEAAGASCQPIQAFSAEVACADPLHPGAELVFAGCIALGTEEVFCAQAETWACSVEAPVTCYLFLEWCYWPTFVQADQEAICNTPDPDQDTLGDSADLDNADIS